MALSRAERSDFKRVLNRAVLLPIVLTAALSGLLFWQISRLLVVMQRVNQSNTIIAHAYYHQKLLVDFESSMEGYLLTGKDIFLEPYKNAEESIEPSFDQFRILLQDNGMQLEHLEHLYATFQDWHRVSDKLISSRKEPLYKRSPQITLEAGKALMDDIRIQFKNLIESIDTQRMLRERDFRIATRLAASLAISAALLIGGALALYTRRQLMVLAARYQYAFESEQHQTRELRKSKDELKSASIDLERRVLERTAALTTANKELETFGHSLSHDLLAPLRRIDGFSQMLLEDYGLRLDSQGKDYIQRIRNATRLMENLIDDLRNLSGLTLMELRREPVDLTQAVQDIFESLQRQHPSRHVIFKAQDNVKAMGDSELLHTGLQKLLENAWKFSEGKSNPIIEFGCIPNHGMQGQQTYFIRDNGIGFDMAYAQHLFGAFQKLHNRGEPQSTGIGLAIFRRIIHRHGGQVWAESTPEHGATFYFTLGTALPSEKTTSESNINAA